MKKTFPTLMFLLLPIVCFSQVDIKNDTISWNLVPLGVVQQTDKGYFVRYCNRDAWRVSQQSVIGILRATCDNCKIKKQFDEFLFYPRLEILNDGTILRTDMNIGRCEITRGFNGYVSDAYFISAIITSEPAYQNGEILKKRILNHYKENLNLKYVEVELKADYIPLAEILRNIQERRRVEQERRRVELEKNRIEQFLDGVYRRLQSNELDKYEGVYESIDQGEMYEYSIVLLKEMSNQKKYVAWVLSSTDPDILTGWRLFELTKSAQDGAFLASYETKRGEAFANKLVTISSGILNADIKSYLKMYPAEGERRRYSEINPLVDWESSGSGVLLNGKGLVATNHHVVDGAKKIRVQSRINDSTKAEFAAKILMIDVDKDIAILQIDDSAFHQFDVKLLSSENVTLGEKVFTIGYPISDKMSDHMKVVDGIVSSKMDKTERTGFFQTSLPVWYGNSGGPCFNDKGELLGLVTEIQWDSGEKVENVCFVTNTSNLLSLLNQIEGFEGFPEATELTQKFVDVVESVTDLSLFIKVNY